jgi:hypothetical protein
MKRTLIECQVANCRKILQVGSLKKHIQTFHAHSEPIHDIQPQPAEPADPIPSIEPIQLEQKASGYNLRNRNSSSFSPKSYNELEFEEIPEPDEAPLMAEPVIYNDQKEAESIVERILSHRVRRQRRRGRAPTYEYHVKWLNYSDDVNTWEPVENFTSPGAKVLLRRYNLQMHILQPLDHTALFPYMPAGDPLAHINLAWEQFGGKAALIKPSLCTSFLYFTHNLTSR